MPLIGGFGGIFVKDIIESYDHWIIFGVLLFLGVKMIREWLEHDKDESKIKNYFSCYNLLILGLVTSIDALAIGVSFSLLDVNIVFASALIGCVTMILCFLWALLANKFSKNFAKYSECIGWVILIIIGCKILLWTSIFLENMKSMKNHTSVIILFKAKYFYEIFQVWKVWKVLFKIL